MPRIDIPPGIEKNWGGAMFAVASIAAESSRRRK
jgi:hypothetical protein